jgi:hypothetical protein
MKERSHAGLSLIIALACGCILNTLVVLLSALMIDLDEYDDDFDYVASTAFAVEELPDGTYRETIIQQRWSAVRFEDVESLRSVEGREDSVRWRRPIGLPQTFDSSWDAVYEARGWPCYALWCEFREDHSNPSASRKISGGFDLRFPRPSPPDRSKGGIFLGPSEIPAAMPLRPLWLGLLVNSVFYGLFLWLLWFTPRRIVRGRSRRRRGLCVRCEYDLRGLAAGSACPECGGTIIPVQGDRC